jgi:MFS family permease
LLLDLGMSFEDVFRVAAVIAAIAAIVVLPLHRRSPELRPGLDVADGPPLGPALVAIARSRAAVPLLMVLLCACLFTTMNSFQTTFATTQGLSFGIFYISYTISVIFTRFVLVRGFRNPSSPRVLAGASSGIVVAVLLFLAVAGSAVLYGMASVLLGITYGLTLPAVQAGAVNASAMEYRPRILPLVGLMFEVAILAFPLVAGTIIAASGYTILFVVLLGIAVAIALLGMREAVLGQHLGGQPAATATAFSPPASPPAQAGPHS